VVFWGIGEVWSSGNAYAETWRHYLEANADLQSYHLDEALRGFVCAAKWRNILNRKAAVDLLAGPVLTNQAMQRPDDTVAAMEEFLEFTREMGDPQHFAVAESCQARRPLLQGDLTPAVHWAR